MVGSTLLCLVLVALGFQNRGEPDPARLVEQLGATSFGDRVAAGEALVKLGQPALPALIQARESRDLEVRLRAAALVTRIEVAAVFDATLVQLDLTDRSVAEAAEAITRASGMRLRASDAQGNNHAEPPWPDRRVTLHITEPTPFWAVLDQFRSASGMQREYDRGQPKFSSFMPVFYLPLITGRARPPASDHGSLRVELLRVSDRRDRSYGDVDTRFGNFAGQPSPRDPTTGAFENQSYTAELLVSAEPRLRIFGVGPIEGVQATDDQGRSLIQPATAESIAQQQEQLLLNPQMDPQLHSNLRYGSGNGVSTATRTVQIPLAYRDPPAGWIARLRGVLPVMVITRQGEPLVVPLQDAVGKEFAAGSTKIQIHEIKSKPGQEPTVEFTLETPPVGDDGMILVNVAQGTKLAATPPSDLLEIRLEVLDDQGNSLFWQVTHRATARTPGRITIVIHDRDSRRHRPETLRLRCWNTAAAATDLPFEFRDVPTP